MQSRRYHSKPRNSRMAARDVQERREAQRKRNEQGLLNEPVLEVEAEKDKFLMRGIRLNDLRNQVKLNFKKETDEGLIFSAIGVHNMRLETLEKVDLETSVKVRDQKMEMSLSKQNYKEVLKQRDWDQLLMTQYVTYDIDELESEFKIHVERSADDTRVTGFLEINTPTRKWKSNFSVEDKVAKRIRHELILSYLMDVEIFTSDEKLSTIGVLGDTADDITPDWIDKENKIVMEFKTRENPNSSMMFNFMNYYRPYVNDRDPDYLTRVTVVSEDRVYTNTGPFREIREMKTLFRYALQAESAFSAPGIGVSIYGDDIEVSEYFEKFRKVSFTGEEVNEVIDGKINLRISENPKMFVTPELVDHHKNMEINLKPIIKQCVEDANKKYKKDYFQSTEKQLEEMARLSKDLRECNWTSEYPELKGGKISKDRITSVPMFEITGNNPNLFISSSTRPEDSTNLAWTRALNQIQQKAEIINKVTDTEVEEIVEKGFCGPLVNYTPEMLGSMIEDLQGEVDSWSKKEDKVKRRAAQMRKENRERRLEYLKANKEKLLMSRGSTKESRILYQDLMNSNFEDIFQAENMADSYRTRSEQHRVVQNLSDENWEDLSRRGIRAKKFKHTEWAKKKKAISKMRYSLNVDTSDISSFIAEGRRDDSPLFSKTEVPVDLLNSEIMEKVFENMISYKKGTRSQHFKEMIENARDYTNTKIGRVISSVDRMLEEINLSFTQHTSSNHMLCKRIPNSDCYLLIKTTTPDAHLFYSVLVPKGSQFEYDEIFPIFKEYNNEYVRSDFYSISRMRLSHLLFGSEFFCVMNHYLKQLFGDIKRARTHLLNQMLFYYENTSSTCENLLQYRFLYMKATIVNLLSPGIHLGVEKLSENLHTRYSVWIAKRYLELSEQFILNKPTPKIRKLDEIEIDDDKKEKVHAALEDYDNLFSITGDRLDNYTQCLYISYMGCTRNKDEGDKNQGSYKILTKIAKAEDSVRLLEDDFAYTDKTERPKDHEFSPSFVLKAGEKVRDYIKRKRGTFGRYILRKFMRAIKKKRIEDLATFKSSAVRTVKTKFNDAHPKSKLGRTVKCVEGIMSLIRKVNLDKSKQTGYGSIIDLLINLGKYDFIITEDDWEKSEILRKAFEEEDEIIRNSIALDLLKVEMSENPLDNILEMLEILENRNGVYTILFKKQQLTGPREIFILDIVSRIVINFIETFARAICEELPMETLTKGKTKYKISEEHYSMVNALKKKKKLTEDVTGIDSDDKTNWCQQFTMPLFSCFLTGLMLRDTQENVNTQEILTGLHKVFSRILNCVASKQIQIPVNMMEDWVTNKNISSMTPINNKLQSDFLGESDYGLINKMSVTMNNFSNMMQGILHYFSSMMACGCSMMISYITGALADICYKKNLTCNYLRIEDCVKNSSDDSSFIRTVIYEQKSDVIENSKNKNYIIFMISLMSYIGRELARHTTMYHSYAKSTSPDFSGKEEYNSIWTVANVTISPLIKFIYACLKPKTTSNLEDRVRIATELRKQLLENGSDFELINVMWFCQMSMHYKCLGTNTNKFFPAFFDFCDKLKNPALGWFLLDDPVCPNILGYDKMLLDCVHENENTKRSLLWLLKKEGLTADDMGRPSVKVSMQIGSRYKYDQFLRNISPPSDYELIMERRPEMSCRPLMGLEESVFKIYKKSKNPSSAEAFDWPSISKMHSSSMYILERASVMYRKKTIVDNIPVWESVKSSLIGIMLDCYNWCNEQNQESVDNETERIMHILFPKLHHYSSFDQISNSLANATINHLGKKLSTRKVDFTVPMKLTSHCISFKEWLGYYWFAGKVGIKRPNGYSRARFQCATEVYTKVYPWIKSSYAETVNDPDFPFTGIVNMSDFISSAEEKSSTVSLICPAYRTFSIYSQFESIIRYTSKHGCVLLKQGKKLAKKSNDFEVSLNKVKHTLNTAIVGPYTGLSTHWKLQDIMKSNLNLKRSLLVQNQGEVQNLTKNDVSALVIQHIIVGDKSNETFSAMIEAVQTQYQKGILSCWIQEQQKEKRDDGKYYWIGEGKIMCRINNILAIFTVMNDVIKSVILSRNDISSKDSMLLRKFLDRLRLKFESPRRSTNDFWMNSDCTVVSRDQTLSTGCRVTLSGNNILPDFNFRDSWISGYYGKCIKVMNNIRGTDVCLYSYTLDDSSSVYWEVKGNDVFSKIHNQVKISGSDMLKFGHLLASAIPQHNKSKGEEAEDYKYFLRERFYDCESELEVIRRASEIQEDRKDFNMTMKNEIARRWLKLKIKESLKLKIRCETVNIDWRQLFNEIIVLRNGGDITEIYPESTEEVIETNEDYDEEMIYRFWSDADTAHIVELWNLDNHIMVDSIYIAINEAGIDESMFGDKPVEEWTEDELRKYIIEWQDKYRFGSLIKYGYNVMTTGSGIIDVEQLVAGTDEVVDLPSTIAMLGDIDKLADIELNSWKIQKLVSIMHTTPGPHLVKDYLESVGVFSGLDSELISLGIKAIITGNMSTSKEVLETLQYLELSQYATNYPPLPTKEQMTL